MKNRNISLFCNNKAMEFACHKYWGKNCPILIRTDNFCENCVVEYLRVNHYSGVTVLRGITGFGRASKIHSSDILELSSDLPIIIEIVDIPEKIEELKKVFDETNMIGSALITEEKVKIIKYGSEN